MSRLVEVLLKPLADLYNREGVGEVRMVEPEQVILAYRGGRKEIIDAPDLTWNRVLSICEALANLHKVNFDAETESNLSTITPEGHRFECLVGASVGKRISMTIRVKHQQPITLYDLGLKDDGINYLQNALDNHWNIIVSGGTYSGKTTLLNNILSRLPHDRRVISAEDTPELETEQFWQGVSLYAAREQSQGTGQRTYAQLYNHKMRSSPDNIIFGEISIDNAKAALTALNTGARGFVCTVHADGPELVPRRFEDNINTAGEYAGDVEKYMRDLVDLIVQVKLNPVTEERYISDLYEMKNGVYIMKDRKYCSDFKALGESHD